MKKLVTVLLAALLAVGCIFVFAACGKPLENPDSKYVLAGQHPGWGLTDPKDPTDAKYADRVMEAIKLNDKRVASIKDKLTEAKYLYVIEWTYVASDAGTDPWTYNPDGQGAQEFDGNFSLKVIKYTETDGIWAETWYISPESGGNVNSLTPDTLWIPKWEETPEDGSDGWNANCVLLKGAGKYLIVFADFTTSFGIGAIQLAD